MKVLLASSDFSIQLKDTPAMISRPKDVESAAVKAWGYREQYWFSD
jgi:hypothetical protein